jgi:membrane protein YqaA with SNARE-associated domain
MISFAGILQMPAKMFDAMVHTSTYFLSNTITSFMQQSMILIWFGSLPNVLCTLAGAFFHGQVKRLIYNMEWS